MPEAPLEPRPVLKWAGGKRQLLREILARLPRRIETYHEPFVGGAAVFFALAAEKRFRHAVIADKNADVVNVYLALRDDVGQVIDRLGRLSRRHSAREYYRIRAERPRSVAARAARILYLNKTAYNGLYRVNQSGQFNVPLGRYDEPRIVDEARLTAASQALSGVDIRVADFEQVCAAARAGDAVYLDPPYLPVSRTSHFAAYHREPFGLTEHQRLARVFKELSQRGVASLLSNSNTRDTRALFGDFEVCVIGVRRSINSNPARRGPVPEILVSTPRVRRRRLPARGTDPRAREGP